MSSLGELLRARDVAHGATGSAPMESVGDLRAWLGEVGMAFQSGRGVLPSAPEAIVAGSIEGSWWGHPEGGRVYRLLSELEEAPGGSLELVLAEGKRTLVAPALVPAVKALAADEERRRRVVGRLPPGARRLWEAVGSGEVVRSDDGRFEPATWRRARACLEAGLLAGSTSEHTPAGRHVAVVEVFGEAGTAAVASPLREVVRAVVAASVVVERRQLLKSFRSLEPDAALLEAAVEGSGARSLPEEGRTWLTLVGA